MTTKNKAISALLAKIANDTYTQLDLEAIKLISNIEVHEPTENVLIEKTIELTEDIVEVPKEVIQPSIVRKKASEFGRKVWTLVEEDIIKNAILTNQTIEEVIDLLPTDRTADSIKGRVYKLGGSVYGSTIVPRIQ